MSLLEHIDTLEAAVVDLQRLLVSIPALGPTNGGDGEKAKADAVIQWARAVGFQDIEEVNVPDDRVPSGYRPNLVLRIPGEDTGRTFWIISHLDIVPPGDFSLWEGDPYELIVRDGYVIGRGVEDNHQGVVASLILGKAMLDTGRKPPMNLGVLLVADEETGSAHGLDYVARNRPEFFGPDDLILVPDFGEADSGMVEVAEKSLCWLKFAISGKQCHASTPQLGVNTFTATAALVLRLRELYNLYNDRDELFDPPFSTFESTKKEANVPNVNTIPGYDVFYLDCRIMPHYNVDDILETIRGMMREIEKQYGVHIVMEEDHREDAAPATDPDSPIVQRIIAGIRHVYGTEAKPTGIGGGTVAAYLRRKNLPAVVWGTWVPNAHQPNERSLISTNLGDAKVMAWVLFDGPA